MSTGSCWQVNPLRSFLSPARCWVDRIIPPWAASQLSTPCRARCCGDVEAGLEKWWNHQQNWEFWSNICIVTWRFGILPATFWILSSKHVEEKIAAMVRERQQTWRFQGVEIGISSTPMVAGLSWNRVCPCPKFVIPIGQVMITDWWFGTFFIFPFIGNNHPSWLSYFSTTNQWWTSYRFGQYHLGKHI